ncbi:MAG: HNH endonuclease [Saprospiraceae bacterium]|nr:HNH endonuclease [Saprospiraceae bacterium]MCF8252241.1 HNH endonuclease [Saprospiraceae bacterium]MCF8282352.1 HNH endonuclease [Bacteroidales bacterium]MCF8313879.1 HNH endonuclease [Saprospiraceae bacterium]MCF8442898.1 HNH endonuclease [Saprospiraceae bacterium]
MSRSIPEILRAEVAKRAGHRCEYCRRPESDSFIRFQSDHILSRKHGGKTTLQNLAFACPACNNCKGTDFGTVLRDEEIIIRIFNPRKQGWFEHFEVLEGEIIAKSEVGEATIKILKLNEISRILERLDLIAAGIYP